MRRLLALLIIGTLIAGACGRDDDDGDSAGETTTTAVATTDDTADDASETTDTTEGTTDDTTDDASDTTQPADAAVMIGDLPSPCGTGEAAGATDTGVSEDSITVGVFSDHTADINPGINIEILEAAETFVAWCNDQGGIQGRSVETQVFESKLFEANQRAAEACEADVLLMLGAAALDNESVDILAECGVPYLAAFTGSKPAIESPAAHPAIPTPYVSHGVGEGFWFAEEFPDEVTKAGILFSSFASSVQIAQRARAAYEQAGFEFIHEGTHNPQGEANWTPVMQPFKEAGVEVIVSMTQTEWTAAFLAAAAEQDYFPLVLTNSSNFTDGLIVEAGDAAEGVYSYAGSTPIGEATAGSATQFYLDILDTYGDGAEPALLGINSLASSILFATAADACGSDLTRACISEEIGTITEWESGGLHGVTNPGEKVGTPCYAVMQVVDGAWTRISPEEGLDCDPANIVDTDIDYGE